MPVVWRLLPTDARASDALPLRRRGVLHGYVTRATEPDTSGSDTSGTDDDLDVRAAWAAAQPIALPSMLTGALPSLLPCIEQSLALFDHLRDGGRFLDAILELLDGNDNFRPEGSTFDRQEPREIEKVFVSGQVDGKRVRAGRDVWAKLAWIAHDEDDLSLRIRFSCGTEQLHDWQHNVEAQAWSDRFAEALFPECAAIAQNPELLDLLQQLIGAPPRLSERILYSNAPGGGAVFHHDADTTQRGVVYGQMYGATAWLALPVSELARHVAEHASATARADLPSTHAAARERLEKDDDTPLFALLNQDPGFSQRLAAAGWLSVLEAGDALLLPSHDRDLVAWHSVFALGDQPSLAHSYGIFSSA